MGKKRNFFPRLSDESFVPGSSSALRTVRCSARAATSPCTPQTPSSPHNGGSSLPASRSALSPTTRNRSRPTPQQHLPCNHRRAPKKSSPTPLYNDDDIDWEPSPDVGNTGNLLDWSIVDMQFNSTALRPAEPVVSKTSPKRSPREREEWKGGHVDDRAAALGSGWAGSSGDGEGRGMGTGDGGVGEGGQSEEEEEAPPKWEVRDRRESEEWKGKEVFFYNFSLLIGQTHYFNGRVFYSKVSQNWNVLQQKHEI